MKMSNALFELSPEQYDVVGFDWDGTVIDTVPYKIRHNRHLAELYGNHFTTEEVRTIWNKSRDFPELMEALTGSTDMAAIMAKIKPDYDKPRFAKRKFEFTDRSLKAIGRSTMYTALLTSASRGILNLDQDSLGLDVSNHFNFIQTADDTKSKKPSGEFFAELLERTEVDPARVIYIGDELKDGIAAREAGIDFMGVERGMATRGEFMSAGLRSVRDLGRIASVD